MEKGKKVLEHYSLMLQVEVNGIKCEMQLDTAYPFSCITDDFIKKHKKLSRKKKYFSKSIRIWKDTYPYIKNVTINIDGLGLYTYTKCNVELIQTKEELKSIKELEPSGLDFAGYLGNDIFKGKVFEINFINNTLIFYNENECNRIFNNFQGNPFVIYDSLFYLPITINNIKCLSIYDSASSRYPIILSQNTFRKIIKKPLNRLPYENIVRPDFLSRLYYHFLRFKIRIQNLDIETKSNIYTFKYNDDIAIFPKNSKYDSFLGNVLFFNKRLIFDTKKLKYIILNK